MKWSRKDIQKHDTRFNDTPYSVTIVTHDNTHVFRVPTYSAAKQAYDLTLARLVILCHNDIVLENKTCDVTSIMLWPSSGTPTERL